MKKIFCAVLAVVFMASASFAAVNVQEFNDGLKLHSFGTGDNMNDYCYIIEGPEGLVMIESTAYKADVNAFNEYIKSLNKPLVAMLLSYHPNGYKTYGDVKVYATEGALKSWQEGGTVWGLTLTFVMSDGDKVADDLPVNAEIITEGQTIKLAGIDFVILHESDGENYGIFIPAMNAVYRHMMGSKTHSILTSIPYIEAEIAELKDYQAKGYEIILTSHHEPEGKDAVSEKIAYLEKVLEIAKTSNRRDKFISGVKAAFPDYNGEAYLEMTAGALLK
jgi:hypothetical protein